MRVRPAPVLRLPVSRIENLAATGNAGGQIFTQIAESRSRAGGIGRRITTLRHPAGRNRERAAHAVGLTCALVVAEKEQLVFDDRRHRWCRRTAASETAE